MNSNLPKELCIKGKIFSGKDEGKKFITLLWVKKQLMEKMGFTPYPGTLNIKLIKDDVKLRKLLKKARLTEISPATGFCRGRCFKAYLIDNVECAVVIPEIADYPDDVLEIIAPVNLRKKLNLKDGDVVAVKIKFE